MAIDAFKDRSRGTKDVPDMFGNDGGAEWNYGEAAACAAKGGKTRAPLKGEARRAANKALRQGKRR